MIKPTGHFKRSGFGGAAILLLLIALTMTVAACNKGPVSNESPPEPGDVAVARIDGETIWTSDVRAEAIAQGQIGPGEPLDVTSDLFSRTLEEVIDQRLLAAAATNRGLEKSTTAQRRLRAAHDRILGDMLVENSIDRDIDEKTVKEHYDEQVKLSKQSEEIRTRMILLRTRPEAEAALKQIQAGSLFEAMAMEKSIDQGTRFNGGDMGYFTTDIMPQAYKGVLTTAKVGDTVGPVQVEGGWAILRVEDRRPEQMPTLEEERPIIMRYLIYNQVAGMLNGLRKKAKVEFLIPKPVKTSPEPAAASAAEGAASPATAEASQSASASVSASASSAAPAKKGQKT
ncbi:peptidylprolyl isomerase [Asticcacaulis sp. AC466]|uniref:peptidylprolyl isomerase n=1 Tax=Asticcacaulis sp. AC466 TaxID=1282362 RepID=UPI0009DEF7D4|nr:peptidylprolyl isomerase [Asticcacaulis sp. AC466]